MNIFDYTRYILSLNADELEILVRKWAKAQSSEYHSVHRPAGAGDRGCDVIGFCSPGKFEGDWDNYQCKQYNKAVPTDKGMHELGKVLYYSYLGEFSAPRNYYFVAPKGINRNLRNWILNPSKLKFELIEKWSKYCEDSIIDGKKILLTSDLKDFISKYDFSSVSIIGIDDIVDDSKFRAILVDLYGGDLPSAPSGEVPLSIDENEFNYVNKILDTYSDHDKKSYSKPEEIIGHEDFEEDFTEQRERFYSAEAFRVFYRDNMVDDVLENFEKEILKGIKPALRLDYSNSFYRMCNVLSEAGKLQPSGKLAIHGKIDVKQGYCHQFANEDKLEWRKK
ncbi:ABC-three component system protein [Enterovibrio sp. 27052020O]|uniref:ABC-three component system protein n=1 Tax=Enterovibrio sp. 27052020O TaxID=3241166 RepID=UPI00388F318C